MLYSLILLRLFSLSIYFLFSKGATLHRRRSCVQLAVGVDQVTKFHELQTWRHIHWQDNNAPLKLYVTTVGKYSPSSLYVVVIYVSVLIKVHRLKI